MAETIPKNASEATLIYKTIGQLMPVLHFLPPTVSLYDRAPVYVIFPGGGWEMGTPEDMLGFSAVSVAALREMGFAVASVSYRTTRQGAVMHQIISDCFDALRYLARYAEILEINPHRMVLSGHSAGGHLALMMTVGDPALFRDDSPFAPGAEGYTILGCAPISPGTILYPDETGKYLRDQSNAYAFSSTENGYAEFHAASPYDLIRPENPPVLLIAGAEDTLLPPAHSTRYLEKAKSLSAPCRMVLCKNGGHCLEPINPSLPVTPDFNDMQNEIVCFAVGLIRRLDRTPA